MYAILFVLISATSLFAQPWEIHAIALTPQPANPAWAQFHVLPVSNGEAAVISGQWDWLPPWAVFDSVGNLVRGGSWPDPMVHECLKTYPLDLVPHSGSFAGLFTEQSICAPPAHAYCWIFEGSFNFQTIEFGDTATAVRAAHDGVNSYFLCNYRYHPDEYFIAAASDAGELWRLPLYGEMWIDRPFDFCLSTGNGLAYVCSHEEMDTLYSALRMISADGERTYTWFMHEDSIHTPVKVVADAHSGCWVIGVEDPFAPSTELYLYYSEDLSYHTLPLGMTLPPVDMGAVPTLQAIPFGDGIMIAGEATLDSGEECLFTLTYSASGEARLDMILRYTQMLDIASDSTNNYIAAVRTEVDSDIVLLRARSLVSAAGESGILHPSSFVLSVYPNPFNAQTTISFTLPRAGDVSLTLYDLLGREVETLLNEHMAAGSHSLSYSAADLPSGVYFVRLASEEINATHKLLLLK